MEDRLALTGLNAICAVARTTLPEREAFPSVYDAFEIVLQNMHEPDIWPALYIRWEAGLLKAMGYGLDLSSAVAAEPYLDKLYILPDFLKGAKGSISKDDIRSGLNLTGYFLETRVQWGVNKTLPEARAYMISNLQNSGYST